MENKKLHKIKAVRFSLTALLTAGLLAAPALAWAGPKIMAAGPRFHHRPPRVVAAPHAPRHYAVIRSLPRGHKKVVVKGTPYYYHRGVFYRSGSRGYVVVNAPLGFRLGALPHGSTKIRLGRRTCYYHNGNYFRWNPSRQVYTVVPAPRGAAVTYLPQGYARVNISGDSYYKFNGVYYRQEEVHGNMVYVVTDM